MHRWFYHSKPLMVYRCCRKWRNYSCDGSLQEIIHCDFGRFVLGCFDCQRNNRSTVEGLESHFELGLPFVYGTSALCLSVACLNRGHGTVWNPLFSYFFLFISSFLVYSGRLAWHAACRSCICEVNTVERILVRVNQANNAASTQSYTQEFTFPDSGKLLDVHSPCLLSSE